MNSTDVTHPQVTAQVRMKCLYLFPLLVAVGLAAIQPQSPVYRPALGPTPKIHLQPAEERESPAFPQPESTKPPVQTTALQPAQPGTPQSQNYLVYYYPGMTGPGPYTSSSVDYFSSERMYDFGVAGASLAAVAAGLYLLYPSIASVKSRALRELSDLKAEDMGRMAKSVFKALDKFYELQNSKA